MSDTTSPDTVIDATNLSPTELLEHLALYGPRDPHGPRYRHPGTYYHTTSGLHIDFGTKQGIHRDIKVANAYALLFDRDTDRYQCIRRGNTIEVDRVTNRLSLVLDAMRE